MAAAIPGPRVPGMITIYICEKCEYPCLVVWPRSGRMLCRNCALENRGDQGGEAMGDPRIRVIFPNGKCMEMSVTDGVATVKLDGKNISTPAILAGARRKIRA